MGNVRLLSRPIPHPLSLFIHNQMLFSAVIGARTAGLASSAVSTLLALRPTPATGLCPPSFPAAIFPPQCDCFFFTVNSAASQPTRHQPRASRPQRTHTHNPHARGYRFCIELVSLPSGSECRFTSLVSCTCASFNDVMRTSMLSISRLRRSKSLRSRTLPTKPLFACRKRKRWVSSDVETRRRLDSPLTLRFPAAAGRVGI